MDEALKQSINRVTQEEWPGSIVEIDDSDVVRITNKHGRVISNSQPPEGWQNGLDSDEKIRLLIKTICQ